MYIYFPFDHVYSQKEFNGIQSVLVIGFMFPSNSLQTLDVDLFQAQAYRQTCSMGSPNI